MSHAGAVAISSVSYHKFARSKHKTAKLLSAFGIGDLDMVTNHLRHAQRVMDSPSRARASGFLHIGGVNKPDSPPLRPRMLLSEAGPLKGQKTRAKLRQPLLRDTKALE
jgi:hypothetical protein